MSTFGIGAYVAKNPTTWRANDFDSWGRGIGVGVVVTPPFSMDADEVDVKWPNGRCFEATDQLLEVEPGPKLRSLLARDMQAWRRRLHPDDPAHQA